MCTTQVGFNRGVVLSTHRRFGTILGCPRTSDIDVFGQFGIVGEDRDVSA